VKQTESATGTHVTETGTGIGIETGTTVTTATANGKEKGTGTEIMTGIGTATVNGTENVTGIARRRETVAPGITGMTTTCDGLRVTMDVIANEIWRVTRRGTVVTEIVTGMLHEEQVREKTTGNGVQERKRKTEEAMMTLERGERQRMTSEVRKWVAFSF